MTPTQAFGLDALVERRIEDAIARGEFDHLPGEGQPLALDDDPLVPEEMRAACRILKNAGCVPSELSQLMEVNRLLGAAMGAETDEDGSAGSRRLRALLVQLELGGRTATAQAAWHRYRKALARRTRTSSDRR